MSLIFFYVPTPGGEVAENIATTLLNENLIACANILPPHKALYRWEGKTVEDESEHVMILKTVESKAKAVEEKIKALHPYECPCIAQIKASDCNADYLNWAQNEVT